MSKKRSRRNKNVLSLKERVDVIADYGTMTNARLLARKYSCGRTQIQNIIKARHKLVAQYKKIQNNKKSKLENGSEEEIENAMGTVLCEWIKRSQVRGLELTESLLENVAMNIAPLLGVAEYQMKHGWLKRILLRYEIMRASNAAMLDQKEPKSLKYTDIMDELGVQYIIPAGMEFYKDTLPSQLNSLPIEYGASIAQFKYVQGSFESSSYEDEDIKTEPISIDDDSESDETIPEEWTNSVVGGTAKEVNSYREALNVLGPLERFTLLRGNVRAVGLINQLENLFRDELEKILQEDSTE